MRVIFIKDLKKQGKKGEIKEVKDGFANNFLIKNGYAVQETPTSVNILAKDKKIEATMIEQETASALKLKEQLEKEIFVFIVKTGKEDKVFGSISSKLIHEELIEKGYKIDKKKIVLKEAIDTLGIHNVIIELYKNIKATIKIQLVSR